MHKYINITATIILTDVHMTDVTFKCTYVANTRLHMCMYGCVRMYLYQPNLQNNTCVHMYL